MAEQKTKPTTQSVEQFLEKIGDKTKRDDCFALAKLMKRITGAPPKMWGAGIVGFRHYHYKYESGHEGDSCLTGFAPRSQNIALYVMLGAGISADQLKKLGKHKASKGCLYIRKLADVDTAVLEAIIAKSVAYVKKKYPA